jgi:hypothetical protein
MAKSNEPIQSDVPRPGLSPLELTSDLLSRIDRGNQYARSKKKKFQRRSTTLRIVSLIMSVASTLILGWQDLNFWSGLAFALITVVTVVNTLEPFFAWRSLWVVMEEAQSKFYRLRDEVSYYLAAVAPDDLDSARIRTMFDSYQQIWDDMNHRWLENRRPSQPATD